MRMFEFRRIIDTGGATMLPGMIELYAHLRWFPTDGVEFVSSEIAPCTLPEFNPILESDLPDLLV
jgi:imidazolonepropionase-like amidohydrolase